MTMDFSAQRLSYEKGALSENDLPDDALVLLQNWVNQAVEAKVIEPYAISLATCGEDNYPSVRTVLVREINKQGVVFYTNYDSNKGQDIAQNPKAEALFFWHSLERQVRIRGTIKKVTQQKSVDYFHKRPHDSQVAAWVSQPQSGEVASREVMEEQFAQLKQQYPDGSVVPMPKFWGGYELVAEQVEFWQGRANRMHDRIVYSKVADKMMNQDSEQSDSLGADWQIKRVLP